MPVKHYNTLNITVSIRCYPRGGIILAGGNSKIAQINVKTKFLTSTQYVKI